MITGLDGLSGRLNQPTSTDPFDDSKGCGRGGSSASVPTTLTDSVSGSQVSINDDLLTCYILPTAPAGTTISSFTTAGYSTPVVLDAAIYNSPRFFWVPVFNTVPVQGSSTNYPIKEFRPAFLTDQPLSASRATPTVPSTYNGLTIDNNGLTSMSVVFFNKNALPPGPGGVAAPSQQIVHLIN
jgi:hypothetical protein